MYAITRQKAPTAPDLVTGTFTILSHALFILIEPGFACSFIAYKFVLKVHGIIEALGYNMRVSIPFRGTMIVNMVIRECPIEIEGRTLLADLVVINLEEFDVILGMDWLSKHHTIMNCYTKEVIIETSGQEKIVLVGERKIIPSYLISATMAFQLIRDGYEVFLANVIDILKVSPGVMDVPVVKEFFNVFLDKLLRLLPHREVDFKIEIVLGTTLISIAPYQMELLELKELK